MQYNMVTIDKLDNVTVAVTMYPPSQCLLIKYYFTLFKQEEKNGLLEEKNKAYSVCLNEGSKTLCNQDYFNQPVTTRPGKNAKESLQQQLSLKGIKLTICLYSSK